MPTFVVSAFGRDRPGIVAAVTGVLVEHGVNIEDSEMAILRGHFAMMLVVSAAKDVHAEELRSALEAAGRALELEAVLLTEVAGLEAAPPEASHVITVYGADHPGIVHAVATALAEREVNIIDLKTRVAGEGLYAMFLEVALPDPAAEDELLARLRSVASEQGVEVTANAVEQDVL